MNHPKKAESTEAKEETMKKDGDDAAEASLDEKDLDGVAGGGFECRLPPPPCPI